MADNRGINGGYRENVFFIFVRKFVARKNAKDDQKACMVNWQKWSIIEGYFEYEITEGYMECRIIKR